MLRKDEHNAWTQFLSAVPQFAGETIKNWKPGPDPPDVLCATTSGKRLGVELTKWVHEDQVRDSKHREKFERHYLTMIQSENRQRPDHIGQVHIQDKSKLAAPHERTEFVRQLFDFLYAENSKPAPSYGKEPIPLGYWSTVRVWDVGQGALLSDFAGYPMLQKYLDHIWIFPRSHYQQFHPSEPWVCFDDRGGAYSHDWLVRALATNVTKKIIKYSANDLRALHNLEEFDLLCYYSDETLVHNTPYDQSDSAILSISKQIRGLLPTYPPVFDRVYLFDPHVQMKAIKIE